MKVFQILACTTCFAIFGSPVLAQRTAIKLKSGDIYVGKVESHLEDTVCLTTKNAQYLCFDSSLIKSIDPYKKSDFSFPLSKRLNPMYSFHDFGVLSKYDGYAYLAGYYSLGVGKRLTDTYSAGLNTMFALGDDVDWHVMGFASKQFRTTGPTIPVVTWKLGWFKELAYWSRNGYETNLGFTLLKRGYMHRSSRMSVSVGYYSGRWITCLDDNCNDEKERRLHYMTLRLSYGWQR